MLKNCMDTTAWVGATIIGGCQYEIICDLPKKLYTL